MANQVTTASALTRLRPVSQPNIGGIVEEWTRYWTKNRDDKEAKELARQAKENEFRRKANEQAFKDFEGLQPEDNAGFLQSQIVARFEENKPYYVKLAKAAANGNMDAKLKLADEKRKIGSVVSANKIYAEKIKELQEQKRKGIYNPQLDAELDGLMNSFRAGKYKLNADWSLDAYSPGLEGTPLAKDGIVRMSASELLSNDFLNSSFNKKANFKENGAKIADSLLDTVNGNQVITPNTKIKGINAVKSLLAEDSVEARSFIREANAKGILNINKPFGELSSTDLNIIAEKYYDENVTPFIQEVDNSLGNTAKRLGIARTRQLIDKGNQENDITTVSLSTDENGDEVVLSSIDGKDGKLATKKATVFNLAGQPITLGVKGKSGSNTTFTSLAKGEDGKIVAIGQEIVKAEVPLFDDNGDRQIDGTGNEKFRIEERTVETVEEDPKVLNNIARNIKKEDGRPLKNLNELSTFLDEKKAEIKPVSKQQAQSTIDDAETLAEETRSLIQEADKVISNDDSLTEENKSLVAKMKAELEKSNALVEKSKRGTVR